MDYQGLEHGKGLEEERGSMETIPWKLLKIYAIRQEDLNSMVK